MTEKRRKSGRTGEGEGEGEGMEERLTFLYRLNIVVSRKRSLCHEAIRKNPLFICASCRWHYGPTIIARNVVHRG